MKSIKRAPLWGRIVIIILILITIITTFKYTQLKKTNKSLNIIINEQSATIKGLEDEKDNLTKQILKLEEENNQKKIETPVKSNSSSTQKVSTTSNNSKNLGKFRISAYCHCSKCCGKSNGITATGTKAAANRTIAVDPKIIPLGSKVIIDGHTYVAEDTGGAIKGNRIDMYFSSHQEALNWGVKYKDVSVIK